MVSVYFLVGEVLLSRCVKKVMVGLVEVVGVVVI